MQSKRIAKKDLLGVGKAFADWYGLTLPYRMLIQWSRTVSYDDVHYFDTVSRESLSDFVARKLTGMGWPIIGDEPSYKEEFTKKLLANVGRFKVKSKLNENWWK